MSDNQTELVNWTITFVDGTTLQVNARPFIDTDQRGASYLLSDAEHNVFTAPIVQVRSIARTPAA